MHHFKPEQLRSLLLTVPEKHRLMILVGFWHGLRVTELVNLTSKDIQHGYVMTKRLKGSQETLQPYVYHKDPVLSEAPGLKELAKLPLDTVLFPVTRFGVHKIMQKAGTKLDFPKSHAHMLKHTCAHVMLNAGRPINVVQKRLGHESGASTLRYLLATDEQAAEGMGDMI
jgi:integrase